MDIDVNGLIEVLEHLQNNDIALQASIENLRTFVRVGLIMDMIQTVWFAGLAARMTTRAVQRFINR